MREKFLKPEIIVVLFVAVFLTGVLMVKPIIGVADNGDFERIMNTAGLMYKTSDYNERYFNFVNREFITTYPFVKSGGYFSSEVILVLIAKLISRIVLFNRGIFDIRFLAFLYCGFFLLFIYLITKYNKRPLPAINYISIILTVLVFTDLGYLAYFNSFYGEALSFTALLLTVAFSVYLCKSQKPRIWALIGFYTAAFFLTGAKVQNAPIGIALGAFGLLFLRLENSEKWKKVIKVGVALIVITSLVSYLSIPGMMRVCNKYQSVFYGVLKNSVSPENDLQELGLTKEYASLAGTHYFMGKYPINIKERTFQKEINSKISPFKVGLFYLKHPSRYIKKLEITADRAFYLMPGFGNYEKSHGSEPKKKVTHFRAWNDFKAQVLPHSLLFVLLFFAAYTVILSVQYFKAKKQSEKIYFSTFILVMLIGIIQFIVPIVCDGEADLSKHLFLFNVCFDIMFIYMSVWLLESVYVSCRNVFGNFVRQAS